jgi:uncharacterized phage protein (TIGR01671 family)
MREILFRGKSTDFGDWLFGYIRQYENGKITICDFETKRLWFVDPSTVGQFTGLTDKNGKKIFEGDIVRDISAYTAHLTSFERGRETKENVERYRYSGKVSVVSFETEDHGSCGCCYHAFSGSGFEAKEVDIRFCEVIGNIHDNPELLETA